MLMIDKRQQKWIEKENNKDNIDKTYQTLLANDEINKQFSYKELEDLCKGISTTKILLYGKQAFTWLLKNFTKNDINNQLLIDEIDILEENQLENQKNDLTKLKDEIINKNTNEIQSKLESIRNTYQNIDTRFKPNLQSIEWKQFVYQKEQNIDVIKILKKNNIDPNFYFQIRYTAEQIIKNTNELSEDQIQFIQQFNTLNRSLNINYQINIPIDKIRNTPKPNNLSDVIKTPDAVFAYPSIREYTTKQPDILTNKNRLSISPKLQADIRSNTPKDQQEELWELIKKNV